MELTEFINSKQNKNPNVDIIQRWNERIIRAGLQNEGEEGAQAYLSRYGTGIAAPKCILMARQAENAGYPQVALGFWKKAFQLEMGNAQYGSYVTPSSQRAAGAVDAILDIPQTEEHNSYGITGFPTHLLPEHILTMQPSDAKKDQCFYVNSPFYWGQPKRDGKKLVVIAVKAAQMEGTYANVFYQSRSTKLTDRPNNRFNNMIEEATATLGSFILEGELTFIDKDGGEHRTGSQAGTYNYRKYREYSMENITMKYCVFSALMADGQDLTQDTQELRIRTAEGIVEWIRDHNDTNSIEMVPTYRTRDEKLTLVAKQKAEHREGEVWFQPSIFYTGGKNTRDDIIRTKYLTETRLHPEMMVTMCELTPTTADGRPFGAIKIRLNNRSAGKIGTGFDTATMARVVERFDQGHREINIVCQGFTEGGQVWHGRLDPDYPFVD